MRKPTFIKTKPLIRENEKTVYCPMCYQWHDLMIWRKSFEDPLLVAECASPKLNRKGIVIFPYSPIDGLPEYKEEKHEYIFIKDGFKIVKANETMKMFD